MGLKIFQPRGNPLLLHRPFAGALGASLYVGDTDPAHDQGPVVIRYRRNYLHAPAGNPLGNDDLKGWAAADSVLKTRRVDHCAAPAAELNYTLPATLYDRALWLQVRTFGGDLENETLYRPRRILADADGDEDSQVMGIATVIEIRKRDGGGVRVRIAYAPSRNGATPTQFRLVKAAGTGTVADVLAPYIRGVRHYDFIATGLTDAEAYTFDLVADAGAVATTLVAAIPFTSDGAGPPAVSSAVALPA